MMFNGIPEEMVQKITEHLSAGELNLMSSMNKCCRRLVNETRRKKFKRRTLTIDERKSSKQLETVLGRKFGDSFRSLTEVKWKDPKSVNWSNRRTKVLNQILHRNRFTLTSLSISSPCLMDINAITWGMQYLQQLTTLRLDFKPHVHYENNDPSRILMTISTMNKLEKLCLKFGSGIAPFATELLLHSLAVNNPQLVMLKLENVNLAPGFTIPSLKKLVIEGGPVQKFQAFLLQNPQIETVKIIHVPHSSPSPDRAMITDVLRSNIRKLTLSGDINFIDCCISEFEEFFPLPKIKLKIKHMSFEDNASSEVEVVSGSLEKVLRKFALLVPIEEQQINFN